MTETLIEKFHQTLPVLEEKVITFPTEYKYVSAYACNKLFINLLKNDTSEELRSRSREVFKELYMNYTFILDFFELKNKKSWPEIVSGLIDQKLLDEINELIS